MNALNLGVVIILCLIELVKCLEGRQFCGSDLANVMSLVCNGRGYNVAFRSDHPSGEKRFKRGIVDECCRRGCSWSTLETYCASTPPNIQIRKRSDFPSNWEADSKEESNVDNFKYDMNEMGHDFDMAKNVETDRTIPERFVALNQNNRGGSSGLRSHFPNKVKRNDIGDDKALGGGPGSPGEGKRASLSFGVDWESGKMEEEKGSRESAYENSLPPPPRPRIPIRHRHRKADQARKSTKERRKSEGQVGTVPPYFLGRTLVLPPAPRKA